MQKRLHTHWLVLPLVAIALFPVFRKLSKTSFFHHYIRVIAEVEARNSHQLEKAAILVLDWQDGKIAAISHSNSNPATLLPFNLEVGILFQPVILSSYAGPVSRLLAAFFIPPVRAP